MKDLEETIFESVLREFEKLQKMKYVSFPMGSREIAEYGEYNEQHGMFRGLYLLVRDLGLEDEYLQWKNNL